MKENKIWEIDGKYFFLENLKVLSIEENKLNQETIIKFICLINQKIIIETIQEKKEIVLESYKKLLS